MRIYKEPKQNDTYPCNQCEVGWGNYSMGKDEKGIFVEINSCQDDCEKYKEYMESEIWKR